MATRQKEPSAIAGPRAPFWGITGHPVANTNNAVGIPERWAADNTYEARWRNAAGTDEVRGISVNAYDQVMVGEMLTSAERKSAQWQIQDNASISSSGFFLVNVGEAYRVTAITWEHKTQSSVAGTAYVEKTPSGTAIGSGTSLMSGTFDLHAIVNATVTSATLSTSPTSDSDNPSLLLAAGDMLSVVIAGTITSLAGVVVTVHMAPLGKSVKCASFYMKANADLVQGQLIFTANRPFNAAAVAMRWSTKSSVAGLNLTITNDTTTSAAGAGTSILTDNSNTGPLATQTANVTYNGTLSTTAATIRLLTGNRLSLEFDGATLTALAGLVITVSMTETAAGRVEKTFTLDHIPGQTDLTGLIGQSFYSADRDYEVLDISETHNVAAGGACKVAITADSGTTAAGAGTVLTTQNTSAGFDLAAAARTTQYTTLPTVLGSRFLLAGDRLSLKLPTGTLTTAAGLQITVSMAPR